MNVSLYGRKAEELRSLIEEHPSLTLVDSDPDVVVCYGGDGTLLAAELEWPSIPKVPLRNSRRGIRCLSEPAEEVIRRLADDSLIPKEHLKLECTVEHSEADRADHTLVAINEFCLNKGRTNASVRFRVWFDDKPYGEEAEYEIIGDGFVVSTPFGSTAYFNQITRGVFWSGIGVAFMYTNEQTNHLVVPDDTVVRARITRGPAILAHDNSSEFIELSENDELTICKAERPAVLLTTDA